VKVVGSSGSDTALSKQSVGIKAARAATSTRPSGTYQAAGAADPGAGGSYSRRNQPKQHSHVSKASHMD
jgi:hypothetical protein